MDDFSNPPTPVDTAEAVAPGTVQPRPATVARLGAFFGAIYFVQGTSSPEAGIASQPLFFLLKDRMRLTASQSATFRAVMSIAWNIKPLYGVISDFFPLFGYRRKSYLLLTTLLASAAWFALGSLATYAYLPTLLILMACSLGIAFSDVLCDAIMVESGKRLGMTGRFQAIQWGAINAASILAGLGGGWLSEHASYQRTFRLAAIFPAIALIATLFCVRDKRARFDRTALATTGRAIGSALGSRPLWVGAGFIFLWNFSPSFGTPLEYYIVDTLGFSKMFLGALSSLGSAASIVGAAIFWSFCRRLSLRALLNLSVAIGVGSTLAYWWLVGPTSAVALTVGTGIISMIASLATFDLAARSCPDKAEGTFFAALMSIANIGTAGSAWLGGRLYDWIGLKPLILVSAVATAACWLVVPFIRLPATNPAVERSDSPGVQES